jgi:3-oxoacyl-[acyl-carrier-protein] synthase-1
VNTLVREILAAIPVTVDWAHSATIPAGNAGGLACLHHGAQMIRSGKAAACLIGGVESYLNIDTLHWLEAQDRLLWDEQPHGLIPGEGAAFVLLCSTQSARELELAPLAQVLGTACGLEPRSWYTGQPMLGEGLSQTFREVLQALSPERGEKVRTIFCDLNGESWRADEWGYAYVRCGQHFRSPLDLRHPAASWGDVGAASGTLLTCMACLASSREFDPRDVTLVWTASDLMPERSVCVLRGASEVYA